MCVKLQWVLVQWQKRFIGTTVKKTRHIFINKNIYNEMITFRIWFVTRFVNFFFSRKINNRDLEFRVIVRSRYDNLFCYPRVYIYTCNSLAPIKKSFCLTKLRQVTKAALFYSCLLIEISVYARKGVETQKAFGTWELYQRITFMFSLGGMPTFQSSSTLEMLSAGNDKIMSLIYASGHDISS